MSRSVFAKSLLLILALALLSIALWLIEILAVKGWSGLNWLNGRRYTPYVIGFLSAVAFVIPFVFNGTRISNKLLLAFVSIYAISILCYEAGRILNYIAYSRFMFVTILEVKPFVFTALILFPVLGFSCWLITDKLIRKTKEQLILYISLIAVLAIPLSLLTIHLNTGFGSQTGWIDAVKMGYPFFWITLLMGISGMLSVRLYR